MVHATVESTIGGLQQRLHKLGVVAIYLFGSAARGEMRSDSDVDVLVEFESEDQEVDHYFDVLFLLEDELGRDVDLALPDTLHPEIRDRVLEEAKRVA